MNKQKTKLMFARAHATIAEARGQDESMLDLVHARALRHYGEGVRQYLAIRLGGVKHTTTAMKELQALLAGMPATQLVAAPGIRARIYHAARHIAQRTEPVQGTVALKTTTLGNDILTKLRSSLPLDDQELLELRYARELPPEELAFVLERDLDEVILDLAAVAEKASAIVAHDGSDSQLRAALVSAFALQDEEIDLDLDDWVPLPAGTLLGGRYTLEDRVGSGAFSDVYRASDKDVPGHLVALKLLHTPSTTEESRNNALRELHLIASVFHPSIVQFKDHGWYDERLWFVMPWYEGESLEARIRREPLSRDEAREIFEPLASALATMHASGLRHQDVKPDNVFLARIQGTTEARTLPVLLDLGVAAKEAEMVVAGTPTYFAPEVAQQFAFERPAPITPKSDVFSLALTLRNSLDPDSQEEVAAGAVETFIEYRAEFPPDPPEGDDLKYLSSHFERWMSPDATQRPTAHEFAEELALLTQPEERRARRRSLMRWMLPLVAAIIAIAASGVYAWQTEARRRKVEQREAAARIAEAHQRIETASQQNEVLAANIEAAQSDLHSTRMSQAELAEDLEHQKGRLGRSQRQLSGTRRNLRETQTELQQAQGSLESTQSRLNRTNQTLAQREAALAEQEARARQLQGTLRDAQDDARETQATLAETQGRVRSLDQELARLRDQVAAETRSRQRAEERATSAEREGQQARDELQNAARRMNQLERQLADAQRNARRAARVQPARGNTPPPGTFQPLSP